MNRRFIIAFFVVALSLVLLISTAVRAASREVLTVRELTETGGIRKNVRLGARVTEDQIAYQTAPNFLLRFVVRDIQGSSSPLSVEFHGVMPDTLKAGRDVILEGDFDGQTFLAQQLLTQCPSKYETPLPSKGEPNHG